MEEKQIKDLDIRLKRIEGQLRGIQNMLGEGKSTKAIITQLSAARSALDKVGFSLIANDLKNELAKNISGGGSSDQQDLKETINLFMKLS